MNIKSILLSGTALSIVLGFSTNVVASESGLKYIGEYTIPTSFAWKNVPFGGLSAIRWHEGEQRFYAISDSRNTPAEGKPRFYKLKMSSLNSSTICWMPMAKRLKRDLLTLKGWSLRRKISCFGHLRPEVRYEKVR